MKCSVTLRVQDDNPLRDTASMSVKAGIFSSGLHLSHPHGPSSDFRPPHCTSSVPLLIRIFPALTVPENGDAWVNINKHT